jgi:hypothetical protein
MELEIVQEVAKIEEISASTQAYIEATVHMLDNIVSRLNNWFIFWTVLEVSAFVLAMTAFIVVVMRLRRPRKVGKHGRST